MRKIIYSMVTSLDSYTEDAQGRIDWHVMNADMEAYMARFMERVDTLLLGRVTYQLLAAWWPTTTENDSALTHKMNTLPKVVFSRTLQQVGWGATLAVGNAADNLRQLKQQQGKDMVILGGSTFAATAIAHDLVDEYHLIINPIVLGAGKPLFQGLSAPLHLNLLEARSFACGNQMLRYRPVSDNVKNLSQAVDMAGDETTR